MVKYIAAQLMDEPRPLKVRLCILDNHDSLVIEVYHESSGRWWAVAGLNSEGKLFRYDKLTRSLGLPLNNLGMMVLSD